MNAGSETSSAVGIRYDKTKQNKITGSFCKYYSTLKSSYLNPHTLYCCQWYTKLTYDSWAHSGNYLCAYLKVQFVFNLRKLPIAFLNSPWCIEWIQMRNVQLHYLYVLIRKKFSLGRLNTAPILLLVVLGTVDFPYVFICTVRNTNKGTITVWQSASALHAFEKEHKAAYKCCKKLNIQT